MLERRVVLEDEADPALLRREPGGVAAVDHDLSVVGALEAGDHAQQGRLPGAAGAEQRRERAGDLIDTPSRPKSPKRFTTSRATIIGSPPSA